jgi:hypothetical protein
MPMFALTIIAIFIMLSGIETASAITVNNIDPSKLHLSDVQKSVAPYEANIGRIILYKPVSICFLTCISS